MPVLYVKGSALKTMSDEQGKKTKKLMVAAFIVIIAVFMYFSIMYKIVNFGP